MRGSSGASPGGRLVGAAASPTARDIRCESAVSSVDQHSSASCCTKPWPLSVRCAKSGNAVRNVDTNLNGRTSLAALERSSSSRISRMATTIVSSPAPPPGWNCLSEVVSPDAFMHCSVELR